jgi:hypothetical protein
MFDPGQMARDRPGPARDRLLVARISGIAARRARWGALTGDEKAAGATELREIAGDCGDLLAEVAGLSLGASQGKGPEYAVRAQAVAELCRLAGADESLIPGWVEEGRRRAEAAKRPPFSGGVRPLGHRPHYADHGSASDLSRFPGSGQNDRQGGKGERR